MKNILYILLSLSLLSQLTGCAKDDLPIIKNKDVEKLEPVAVKKENPMQLYMHYMPWFETKETNDGKWGSHWTMANKDPEVVTDGRRQIASHYYPLIGPYASSDVEVIRYHLLLMKYAGVDGILIDWYGTGSDYDYPANKKNTEAIVGVLDEVGIKFAIVYEDQTLKVKADDDAKMTQAKADMKYLETNFFSKDTYIKIDGKPLLMVFGPQEINQPAKWSELFASLTTKPNLLTLYAHSEGTANNAEHKNASGEYIWVDATDMDTKYTAKDNFDLFVGGAYVGFKDFYKEGGAGESPLAPIDHKGGQLFLDLLKKAEDNKMDYLQLITWNDFGEGTMIEPTAEFGYTFLTHLQDFSKVSYKKDVLESILELYNLKKATKDVELSKKLEQAFYYLVSLQEEEAKKLMNEVKNK